MLFFLKRPKIHLTMRKNICIVFFALLVAPYSLFAQTVTSLSTNFDVSCATSIGFPTNWLHYTPVSGTDPSGKWHCESGLGRKNASGTPTPGMMCTNYWTATSHLDTSYLITPLLDLSGYSKAYLYFDTRTDIFTSNGRLAVLITWDTTASVATYLYVDSTSVLNPNLSINDTAWITHELSLGWHCGPGALPVHIAFRYTGNTAMGTAWYLDNVNIRPSRLNIPSVNKDILPVKVIGNSTSSQINLAFGQEVSGSCNLTIYDIIGRNVHTEILDLNSFREIYTISGLNLNQGMYFIRVSNGENLFTTKVNIQ